MILFAQQFIKTLLDGAGPGWTLAIITVLALLYGGYKAIGYCAGFFERLIASRDALITDTMKRIAEQDARRTAADAVRAEHDLELAKTLERIGVTQAQTLKEIEGARVEIHSRINKMQEDVTTIRGAVA